MIKNEPIPLYFDVSQKIIHPFLIVNNSNNIKSWCCFSFSVWLFPTAISTFNGFHHVRLQWTGYIQLNCLLRKVSISWAYYVSVIIYRQFCLQVWRFSFLKFQSIFCENEYLWKLVVRGKTEYKICCLSKASIELFANT